MQRAWQRALTVLLATLALLAAAPAYAFHAGSTFDKPPGGGGGGGLFYVGSPRERGWTCTACHLDSAARTRVSVVSEPPELIEQARYVPGQAYRLSFTLDNEYLGLDSPRSNYNTLVIAALGAESAPQGEFSGYAAEDFHARGNAILAAAGTQPNQTAWAFDWTAPDAGAGRVTLYIGVVDGNGANSGATATLTDPFGDDVAVGAFGIVESAAVPPGAGSPAKRARFTFGGRAQPSPPEHRQPTPPFARVWLVSGGLLFVLGLLASLRVCGALALSGSPLTRSASVGRGPKRRQALRRPA